MNLRRSFISSAIALSLLAAAHSATNQFLERNPFRKVTLSPDGVHVAMIDQSIKGKTVGVWGDAKEFKPKVFHVSDGKAGYGEITDLMWVGDSNLVLLSKGEDGDVWLHETGLNKGEPKRIAKEGSRALVGPVAGSSRFLVVESPAKGDVGPCRVVEYDLSGADRDGKVRYECSARSLQCVASAAGEIKLVKKQEPNGTGDAWFRYNEASGSETKLENLKPWYKVYGMSGSEDAAVIAAQIDSAAPGIYLFDTSSDAVKSKLTEHSEYRIDQCGAMRFDRADGKAVGLDLATTTYSTYWMDPAMQEIQRQVDEKLPASVNRVVELSLDRKVALVERIFPMLPQQFVVADLATGKFSGFARCGGAVMPDDVGPTKLVEVPDRDGVPLRTILTLPAKVDGGKLPLLIWIRNGVWSGVDRVEWNGEANFFASQGFAVARVNYRGGEGQIGDFYADTSKKEGVLKLFSDLDDTVAALIKANLVDPDRIAIGGEGAGAWAAAYAAKLNPSQYKAALCFNGVYDLGALHDAKSGNDAGGGVSLGFARPESAMSLDDIESLSVLTEMRQFAANVFVCSGKWSPAEYKSQVSAFIKQSKKAGSVVKSMEGDWWGAALEGDAREEAFARAACLLKSM